jgi:hypothetical protein
MRGLAGPRMGRSAHFMKNETFTVFIKLSFNSVGVYLHPPLIVSLTYGTFRGRLSPPKRFDLLKF